MASSYLQHRDRIAAAMKPGFYTIEHLDRDLLEGRFQFWGGEDSAIVTEIADYPGGEKVIQVAWAVGDKDEIVNVMRPRLELWAKLNGCTSVLIEGRKGWERALAPHGYEPWTVTVRKELR